MAGSGSSPSNAEEESAAEPPPWAKTLISSVEEIKGSFTTINSRLDVITDRIEKVEDNAREGTKKEKEDYTDEDFVPYFAASNPFAVRPRSCGTKPQHYDLYGDRTFDALEKKNNSSMRYEVRTLTPALSYLSDIIQFVEANFEVWDTLLATDVRQAKNGEPAAAEDLARSIRSIKGVYGLLNKRHQMLVLRTKFDANPSGAGPAERGVLEFMEAKIHGIHENIAITDEDMGTWLAEFNEKAVSAKSTHAAKQAAQSGAGRGRGAGSSQAATSTRSSGAQRRAPRAPGGGTGP